MSKSEPDWQCLHAQAMSNYIAELTQAECDWVATNDDLSRETRALEAHAGCSAYAGIRQQIQDDLQACNTQFMRNCRSHEQGYRAARAQLECNEEDAADERFEQLERNS